MAEEKKYSIIGEVKIGTDEYRDLIEAVAAHKHDADEYRSKWWNEQSKCDKLEKENANLKKQIDRLNTFIRSKADIFTQYATYCQSLAENAEE